MSKVMITIRARGRAPTVEDVRARYRLGPDEIDADFGVIPVDPDAHDYTILVDERAAPRIVSDSQWEVSGPYANPRIETFETPE